jgi:hypothetical protein
MIRGLGLRRFRAHYASRARLKHRIHVGREAWASRPAGERPVLPG